MYPLTCLTITITITKAKILLKFFYLVGTRKLEVIETITW